MSRNSSGTYSLPAGNPVVDGTEIEASWANDTLSDIGNELTNSIDKGGRTTPTANLPMGGFILTGLGAGAAAGQSVRVEQVNLVGLGTIASAGSISLFTATEGAQQLTGVTTITSFGANTAGQLRLVRYTGAGPLQLTYNATSMILPGATNLTLQTGDSFWALGLGSSNAYVFGVTRGAGLATRLSDLGNAAANATLANGAFTQTWGWSGTFGGGSGIDCFTFSGTDATPSSPSTLLKVSGNLGRLLEIEGTNSTGVCFISGEMAVQLLGGTRTTSGNGTQMSFQSQSAGAGANGTGGDFFIASGSGDGTGESGDVFIQAGNHGAGSGAAGNISIIAGTTSGSGTPGKVFLGSGKTSISVDGGTPTISVGGGTGATVAGSQNQFTVTFGTGSPTSVTIAIGTRTNAPVAVTGDNHTAHVTIAPSTTDVVISSGTAFAAGTKVSVMLADIL